MKKALFILSLVFLLLTGCRKDKSAPPPTEDPAAVTLIFPYNNFLCNVGTAITATESTVTFEWEASENTDSYELVIENPITGNVNTHQTTDTKIPITLKRNTPYNWHVISKSGATTNSAESDIWKFWNAGTAVTSYAPFPAEIVSPAMSATIGTTDKISLEWIGNDVDNDIVEYDVYFGTSATTPSIIQSSFTETVLNDVPVTADTVYYWKIITRDAAGNESDSGVYQFKVK